MRNIMIPGMYENHKLNFAFLDFYNKHKEYFYDDVNFRAAFGNFQYCSWDGGRIFGKNLNFAHTTKEQIQDITNIYNNIFDIPIRFVFTNTIIEEKDCYDRFNNIVLDLCQNNINEIVINSPILEEYIRNNYPNYHFISSTTKCLTNLEEVKTEINNPNYDLICLDYNLNKNKNFLESLSQEEKDKTELLVNAICGPGCPNRKEHYKLNSLYALNYGKPYTMRNCSITTSNIFPKENSVVITPEEIEQYYLPNGFSNFKLEGRTFSPLDACINLVKYTVKPKYQFYVISEIMKAVNKNE